MPNIICLFDGIEMASDLFDAATCWADDVVIAPKVLNKEVLGSCGIGLISAVRHRLSAASLVEREMHIEPKSLQKLQGSNSDLREDHVDIAGNEETNA